jgi:polysaccharide biosynthesis protein PslH
MRVMFIARRSTRPLLGGGELRLEQSLTILSRHASVALVVTGTEPGEPIRPAGVDYFAAARNDPRQLHTNAGRSWLWRRNGHPFDAWWSPDADRAVRQGLAEFRPDVVVLLQLWMRHALPLMGPDRPKVVLDEHNIEGPLRRQLTARARQESGRPSPLFRVLVARTTRLEASVVAAADQIWVCSDDDRELGDATYPQHPPIHVIPNAVRTHEVRAPVPGAVESPVLVFPGAFGYAPNVRAARFLAQQVMPGLRAWDQGARVIIVGSNPPPDLLALSSEASGIEVAGDVPSMEPFFRAATVLPVPLFEGGGTRFKVLEAFAAGVPVVASSKAVEGLSVTPGTHYLHAETPDEFVRAIMELHVQLQRREALIGAAWELLQDRYSHDAVAVAYEKALASL